MNKLVLLSEVRIGKSKLLESNKVKNVQEGYTKSYIAFKEKFDFFQNEENFIKLDSRKSKQNKYERKLNEIIKKIFLLDNKIMLIKLFNSIYNDDLGINTRIEYIKNKGINNEGINLKSPNYDIRILAEDEYRKFEYQIQFQAKDDENIAIIIKKINFINDCDNIISFNKKRKEYENNKIDWEKNSKNSYDRCLIMLNSNIQVPDVYEFKSSFEGQTIDYKINVMKSWKYDFKQLFEKNMYLLFPVKVLDLRKRLLSISQDMVSRDLIKDEIVRFFRDMNRYLMKVKYKNLITDKDIDELNLIAIDLLSHCIKEKNNIFIDIKTDIEATLKDMVV